MTTEDEAREADEGRLERGVGRLEPERACVGDTVECDVHQPYPQTHRLTLETPAAADYASRLLADPRSGWRKVRT